MAVVPLIQHGEPQCEVFWQDMMKQAVAYKRVLQKKSRTRDKGKKDAIQREANGHFNRFQRNVGHLARQCGLPQDTCATHCKSVKVDERKT
tara:strand:- start:199 stop:471 length:273 start_codon:yes stop_codon:yes gene_type:complete